MQYSKKIRPQQKYENFGIWIIPKRPQQKYKNFGIWNIPKKMYHNKKYANFGIWNIPLNIPGIFQIAKF